MRLPLSNQTADPPKGFSQIQDSLSWLAFAAAEPAQVPREQIPLLVETVETWQRESRWAPDDGSDDWTNLDQVEIRTLTGRRLVWEGDCENLTLKLIERLGEAGIPKGALRLLAAELTRGNPTSGHLFLAIETEEKTLLYDCRRRGLIEWGHPTLAGVAMTAATDSGKWKGIRT